MEISQTRQGNISEKEKGQGYSVTEMFEFESCRAASRANTT